MGTIKSTRPWGEDEVVAGTPGFRVDHDVALDVAAARKPIKYGDPERLCSDVSRRATV